MGAPPDKDFPGQLLAHIESKKCSWRTFGILVGVGLAALIAGIALMVAGVKKSAKTVGESVTEAYAAGVSQQTDSSPIPPRYTQPSVKSTISPMVNIGFFLMFAGGIIITVSYFAGAWAAKCKVQRSNILKSYKERRAEWRIKPGNKDKNFSEISELEARNLMDLSARNISADNMQALSTAAMVGMAMF